MNVLVAEDHTDHRESLAVLLECMGHSVVAVPDGSSAWMAYSQARFQVAIVDWMMPGLDGVELCRKIRSTESRNYPYIIMVTARSGKENVLTAIEAGADDFITKPYDPDILSSRLCVAERMLAQRNNPGDYAVPMLPTCMYCKSIRTPDRGWIPIETYFSEILPVRFTHGVCQACYDAEIRPTLNES